MVSYSAGALATLAASIGAAVIIYGSGVLPLEPLNIPAWVLGPLGIYTIAYALAAGRDTVYYLVWGVIMSAIALASATYELVSPFVIAGSLILLLVVIGLLAYWRKKR